MDGLLDRQVADVERAFSAALDMRKLNQAAGGLLAGPAGRAAAAPTSKRQVLSYVIPVQCASFAVGMCRMFEEEVLEAVQHVRQCAHPCSLMTARIQQWICIPTAD